MLSWIRGKRKIEEIQIIWKIKNKSFVFETTKHNTNGNLELEYRGASSA